MSRWKKRKGALLVMLLLIFITMTGCAKRKEHRHICRQDIPAEAIEACKGRQIGDNVEFEGCKGETVKASCQECNGQLAAVPEGAPHINGQPLWVEES